MCFLRLSWGATPGLRKWGARVWVRFCSLTRTSNYWDCPTGGNSNGWRGKDNLVLRYKRRSCSWTSENTDSNILTRFMAVGEITNPRATTDLSRQLWRCGCCRCWWFSWGSTLMTPGTMHNNTEYVQSSDWCMHSHSKRRIDAVQHSMEQSMTRGIAIDYASGTPRHQNTKTGSMTRYLSLGLV